MNEEQKRIAIQLADEKIRELQAFIQSLRNGDVTRSKARKRGHRENTKLHLLAKAIHRDLSNTDAPSTPKDIYSRVGTSESCTDAQVRLALGRYKDELFDSPEYGKWQTVEQKIERQGALNL